MFSNCGGQLAAIVFFALKKQARLTPLHLPNKQKLKSFVLKTFILQMSANIGLYTAMWI